MCPVGMQVAGREGNRGLVAQAAVALAGWVTPFTVSGPRHDLDAEE